MMKKAKKRWSFASALAAVVATTGILSSSVTAVIAPESDASAIEKLADMRGPISRSGDRYVEPDFSKPSNYIVRFKEQPVALYDGSQPGLKAPERVIRNQRERLNTQGAAAKTYESFLADQQTQRLDAMSQTLGRAIQPRFAFKHAINAVVAQFTAEEAKRLSRMEGVVSVEREKLHQLTSDVGPGFIGAASVWWGTSAGQDTLFASGFENNLQYRGDNVVIGVIDSGYNSASPSFSATDEFGYTITNPLGDGNFIGQCNVPNISTAGCNNKVIGVYDFVNDGVNTPFSVEDGVDHGSHTASTAGGNNRTATLNGYSTRISGVAPHANLVIYRACNLPGQPTRCSGSAMLASVNQVVQDGVVDVVNFSISGGDLPWEDDVSFAFLSATQAGILVSASAGNSGPLPYTIGHQEPWVMSVAAAEHSRGPIPKMLRVTGPGTPPTNVQQILFTEGNGAPVATTSITANLILSPQFHNQDLTGTDGCTAAGGFAAGTFTNGIALVSRGTCSFIEKVNNAVGAGAVAVVISNNRPGDVTPSVPGATVPVYAILQTDGTNLKTFLSANGNMAPGIIDIAPGIAFSAQPDKLADFSSLGPVWSIAPTWFDVIKPDVQAPGVDVLAAINSDGTANGANAVGLLSGTSMAAPHNAGAAALLAGLQPGWTPMEIKSALMMTAKTAGLTKPDGVTTSDAFDRGAGRIRVDVASKAGLVLRENGFNFLLADPSEGGDPGTLNLPSMQSGNCLKLTSPTTSAADCTFNRKLTSTQNRSITWTASFNGVTGNVSPSNAFTVVANGTFPITVNLTNVPADGEYHFGEMVLTPNDASLPSLHMPIAVRVVEPNISTDASMLIVIPSGNTTGTGTLTVNNTGGAMLNVTSTNFSDIATHGHVFIDQPSNQASLLYSTFLTDADTQSGIYAATNFVIPPAPSNTNLARIKVPGMIDSSGGTPLKYLTGTSVIFKIYTNDGGVPSGAPQAPLVDNAVWSYTVQVGDPKLLVHGITGSDISLDLTAQGVPPTNLAPGTYWLVVYPRINYNANGGWLWFATDQSLTGDSYVEYQPNPLGADTDWFNPGFGPSLAMQLDKPALCGAPWLSTTPANLSMSGLLSQDVTVNVDTTQLPMGQQSAIAYLCLQSNDPDEPVHLVQVSVVNELVAVSEGFDDITTLAGRGWSLQNLSTPVGTTSWFQGNAGQFGSQAGAANSYIAADFNGVANGAGLDTINEWLVTPLITFNLASSMSFYTRTTDGTFPDRLEVRLCTGTVAQCSTFDTATFSTLLLTINPTLSGNDDPTGANGYPYAFTQFTLNNGSGIPNTGTGRIAFRYFVTDGGPNGNNSDYIGIDTLQIQAQNVAGYP